MEAKATRPVFQMPIAMQLLTMVPTNMLMVMKMITSRRVKAKINKAVTPKSSRRSTTSSKRFLTKLWTTPTPDSDTSRKSIQPTKELTMLTSLMKLEFKTDRRYYIELKPSELIIIITYFRSIITK